MADDSREEQRQAEVRAKIYRMRKDEQKGSEKEDDPESAFRKRVQAEEDLDYTEITAP